jgi:hypothetical protein
MLAKDNDLQIIISKQTLITNYSSSKVIRLYLNYKLDQAIIDFGLTNLKNGNFFHLVFKYKNLLLILVN